jgi:hypothetical protein
MPNNTRIALITAYAATPNSDDYFVLDGLTCGTRNILVTTALSACNPYRAGPNTCGIISYGTGNTAGGNYATVAGGTLNNAAANYSFIGAGSGNTTTGPYSFIAGGSLNTDNGNCSVFILGNNISAPTVNTTYVNNLSTPGSVCANIINVNYTSNSANNCGALYVGAPAGATGNYNFNNCGQVAVFAGYDNVESFVTVANTNAGACAYTAFTVGNNSYLSNYAELTINSTNYNAAAAGYVNNSLNAPSAAALYNYGGDLSIATWTPNNIHFIANASSSLNDALIICTNNTVSASNALYGSPVYSNGLLVCTTAGGSPATPTVAGSVYGCTNGSGGSNNTNLGLSAGNALTAGTCNVFVGANAGGNITTGGCNTFVGAGIGFNCSSSTCNTVLIGTNGTSSTTPYLCLANGTLYIAQSGFGCPVSLNITGYVANCNCLNGLTTTNCIFSTVGTTTWTVPPNVITVNAIVVAGGGGGGSQIGSGGGAGGVILSAFNVTPGASTIVTVGSGGAGGPGGLSPGPGTAGCVSAFFSLTALGGASGVSYSNSGLAGGSGSGGSAPNGGSSPGGTGQQPSSTSGGFGNNGGTGVSGRLAGGGGGAGGVGQNGGTISSTAGAGGIGVTSSLLNLLQIGQLSAGNYYVGGGGGGGTDCASPAGIAACGGLGGGGAGTPGSSTACSGTANTGGGGGGGGNVPSGPGGGGGNGGTGVVAIQYSNCFLIGATYVTNDTCTIYYYNGSSWVSRGQLNNAYNTTTCNLFTGCGALSAVSTGNGNTTLGGFAGANITTGCCNTALGFNAGCSVTTVNNTISIGYGAAPSNTTGHTVWGNATNNVCNCVYAAWSTVSDCRDKTNIAPLPDTLGLTFIRQLSPVSYQNDHRDLYVKAFGCTYGEKDGTLADPKQHYGLIAQDVQSTIDTLSTRFDALGYDSEQDGYRLTYEELIAPIIASIKELDARITNLENS